MAGLKGSQTQSNPIANIGLPELKKLPLYHVCLINDDYTPMDFVIDVIERFFYKEHATAIQLMLQIHTQGKAVCGTYAKDIAETKVALVNDYSKINEHPLVCKLEPA